MKLLFVLFSLSVFADTTIYRCEDPVVGSDREAVITMEGSLITSVLLNNDQCRITMASAVRGGGTYALCEYRGAEYKANIYKAVSIGKLIQAEYRYDMTNLKCEKEVIKDPVAAPAPRRRQPGW